MSLMTCFQLLISEEVFDVIKNLPVSTCLYLACLFSLTRIKPRERINLLSCLRFKWSPFVDYLSSLAQKTLSWVDSCATYRFGVFSTLSRQASTANLTDRRLTLIKDNIYNCLYFFSGTDTYSIISGDAN